MEGFKYFHNKEFLQAELSHAPSFVWDEDIAHIQSIPICYTLIPDTWFWHYTKKWNFLYLIRGRMIESEYHVLFECKRVVSKGIEFSGEVNGRLVSIIFFWNT